MKKFLFVLIPLCFIPHIVNADMASANQALKEGNFAKAVEQFKKLADQGNVKAQSHLGYMYYVGEGVPQNYAEAVKWYRKAAAQGDKDAQYNLAVSYAFGEGTKQDINEATIWYRRAAEQGHAIAQYSLGISYAYGEGVEQDDIQAAEWFLKSAEQGYERAQVLLGSKFHTGDGIPKNYEKAAHWYRKAADRGNAAAQYNLGSLYRAGKGVPQDYDQAIRWFRMSADQGYVAAQNELQSMERAIAGARREVSRPESFADTEQASTGKQQVATTEKPDVEKSRESKTSQVTQKDSLVKLDSSQRETEKAPQQQGSTQATAEQISTEKSEKEKPGFFSKLFAKGEAGKDQDAIEKEETIATAYKDLASEQHAKKEDTTAENKQQETVSGTNQTRDRPATPSNAITSLWARPSIKPPEVESKTETAAVEKEKQAVEIKPIETPYIALPEPEPEITETEHQGSPDTLATEKTESEPEEKRGFFSRLFSKDNKDNEVAVTDTADSEEELVIEEEPEIKEAPVEIKPVETPYKPAETKLREDVSVAESTESEETIETVTSEEEIIEPEEKRGFFSRLFSRSEDDDKETVTADVTDTDVDTETEQQPAATEQGPVEIKPVETPHTPAETEPRDEQIVAEATDIPNTVDTDEEESESGGVFGFFSKFFSGDKEQEIKPDEPVADTAVDNSETDTTDVTEAPLPPAIDQKQESAVRSYAEGEAPADQQLATVTDDAVARHDPELETRLPADSLDNAQWDKQIIESTEETPESTEPSGQTAEETLSDEKQSDDLFKMFGGFFGEDNQEKVTRQKDEEKVLDDEADAIPDTDEETVVAMVEPEEEKSIVQESEVAIEAEGLSEQEQMFETGTDIADTSFETIQTMAVRGDTDAQYELAKLYYSGTGTKQNYSQAFLWYRRAAQQGNMEAQYSLGNMYLMGEGITQSDTEAIEWYTKAAQQGHPAAQNNLLNLQRIVKSQEDSETNIDPDVEESGEQEVTESLQDEQQPGPETDYERGLAYSYGEGVIQNHETAFQYFKKSAEQGFAPAQYKLGVAYAYGEGVEQDLEQAKTWYKKSAEQGYTIAQRSLGNMYTNGDGIEQNKALGLAWYSILAEQGNVMDIHRRDSLKKELSDSEIEEAERLKEQLSSSIKTSSTSS